MTNQQIKLFQVPPVMDMMMEKSSNLSFKSFFGLLLANKAAKDIRRRRHKLVTYLWLIW